jgi:hypothetical protein
VCSARHPGTDDGHSQSRTCHVRLPLPRFFSSALISSTIAGIQPGVKGRVHHLNWADPAVDANTEGSPPVSNPACSSRRLRVTT